jgi:NAD(P)-dependent dehydrogenase (short-subunit alcohol dehydrogenase family)
MDLRGTGVLVTGGSRGLGAALARELAGRGARVVVTARGGVALDAVVAGIRAAGGEAHALPADMGEKEDMEPLAGAAAALVGPIDVLVHNASALGPTPLPLLLDTECEDLEAVLQVNVVGPFRLTKAVGGSMAVRGRGLVVGISSDSAVAAYPGWGAYGVSKAALDHLLRVWAAELADTGVRVLVVDPGEMDTEMHAQALPDTDRAALADPAHVARRLADLIARGDGVPTGTRLEAAAWAPEGTGAPEPVSP